MPLYPPHFMPMVQMEKITLQLDGADFEIYSGQFRLITTAEPSERGRRIITADDLHLQKLNNLNNEWEDLPMVQKFTYEVDAINKIPKITIELIDYK